MYCVQDNGIFNIQQLLMEKSLNQQLIILYVFPIVLKWHNKISRNNSRPFVRLVLGRQLKSSTIIIFSIHHFCEKLNIFIDYWYDSSILLLITVRLLLITRDYLIKNVIIYKNCHSLIYRNLFLGTAVQYSVLLNGL